MLWKYRYMTSKPLILPLRGSVLCRPHQACKSCRAPVDCRLNWSLAPPLSWQPPRWTATDDTAHLHIQQPLSAQHTSVTRSGAWLNNNKQCWYIRQLSNKWRTFHYFLYKKAYNNKTIGLDQMFVLAIRNH